MGRTAKRVPMDFNWPKGVVWKGYLSPYATIKCSFCKKTGYSQELLKELSNVPEYTPGGYTKKEKIRKDFEKLHGKEKVYCFLCGGDGEYYCSEEIKSLAEKWEGFDPPAGEGWQLWETTSEGSPQSPVFATLDDLCAWAEENATTFAACKATKEQWKDMLEKDFVCASFIGVNRVTGETTQILMM